MKIGAGINQTYFTQRAQSKAVGRADGASFSATLAAASAAGAGTAGVKQADFTSMTRQEMLDWANDKIRSGEMSLDEGRPFMAMSMKIPVNGGGLAPNFGDDNQRLDFMQQAKAGIQGALSRNDKTTLDMLNSALLIMQRHQGQATGVDTQA